MRLFGDSKRTRLLIAVTTPVFLLATAATALIGFESPLTSQAHRATTALLSSTATCQQQPTITSSTISATPSAPARGSSVQFRATLTASCATTGLVDFEVYNASGTRAWVRWKDNQQLTG